MPQVFSHHMTLVTDVCTHHACSHYFAFVIINSSLTQMAVFIITNELQSGASNTASLSIRATLFLHSHLCVPPSVYVWVLVSSYKDTLLHQKPS